MDHWPSFQLIPFPDYSVGGLITAVMITHGLDIGEMLCSMASFRFQRFSKQAKSINRPYYLSR